MTTKNMAYDHPAYLTRMCHSFGPNTAGASTEFSKFIAYAGLTVFALTAKLLTVGSSAYTQWNGTATVTASKGDSVTLYRVTNVAAAGATPSLSTATYGPFAISLYDGTSTNTQTAVAGFSNTIPLYGTATTGAAQSGAATSTGGFTVNQGDALYLVRGTDATAITDFVLEYGVTPLANVTA